MIVNPAQIHLALNHVPVMGVVFGTATLAFAGWRKNADLQKFSLAVLAVVTVLSIAPYAIGDATKDFVKGRPGIEQERVNAHEGAADLAFGFLVAVGVVAAATWVSLRKAPQYSAWGYRVLLLLGLVTCLLMARAAHLGGLIHHPELLP